MRLVPLARRSLAHMPGYRRPTGRFVAGALGGFTAIVIPVSAWVAITAPGLPLGLGSIAATLGRWVVGLGLGYAVTTWVLRPHLRHDAELNGRRSLITGTAAAAAVLTLGPFVGRVSGAVELLLGVAVGSAFTGAMFWPWLLSRQTRHAMRELDSPGSVDV